MNSQEIQKFILYEQQLCWEKPKLVATPFIIPLTEQSNCTGS